MNPNLPSPIFDAELLLEKFTGKGGWTYVCVPASFPKSNLPFGWITVWGSIDSYPFEHVKLMPMGDGHLFFAVNANIRKVIQKEAGDMAKLTLYLQILPYSVPEELLECFRLEEGLEKLFCARSESEQKRIVDWIYSAKTEQTKDRRIVVTMERLLKGEMIV